MTGPDPGRTDGFARLRRLLVDTLHLTDTAGRWLRQLWAGERQRLFDALVLLALGTLLLGAGLLLLIALLLWCAPPALRPLLAAALAGALLLGALWSWHCARRRVR